MTGGYRSQRDSYADLWCCLWCQPEVELLNKQSCSRRHCAHGNSTVVPWCGDICKRPISHFLQCCIRQISHNAPFCDRNVHTCAHFCYRMVHCAIWYWCIMGSVRLITWAHVLHPITLILQRPVILTVFPMNYAHGFVYFVLRWPCFQSSLYLWDLFHPCYSGMLHGHWSNHIFVPQSHWNSYGTGVILGMGSANERRCYIVTSSLIG